MTTSQIYMLDKDDAAIAVDSELVAGKHTPQHGSRDGAHASIGATSDAAAGSDAGAASLISLVKRLLVKTTDGLPVVEALRSASDVSSLRIDVAASGDTQLLAAVSGQTHRLHALRLSAPAPVTVQLKDGATVLEVFNLVAGVPHHLPLRGRPYHKGTANTALNINLSGAVQVDGRLEYVTAA